MSVGNFATLLANLQNLSSNTPIFLTDMYFWSGLKLQATLLDAGPMISSGIAKFDPLSFQDVCTYLQLTNVE